ncbi:Kinesin-like protein KIF3A, partial [Symbiodinium microadriaticum]
MADDVGTTTVQVAVRVRPLSEKEIKEGGVECVEVAKDNTVTLHQENQPPNVFAFDNVFGKDSTQPEVFEMLGNPLLDKAFEGYNATIFAYGQTGSGKTHTMMADRKSDDRGLVPRISDNLFQRVSKLSSETRKFLICCSFLEIYNEIVYDLLVPRGKNTPKTGLEIREGKGIGVYVKDLQEIVVDSSEKVLKLIDQGFEHRATAATQMNATSSRSHCLFIIKMHQKDEQNAGNNNFSKMNLVDLAGSERASRTGAQGDTLKEGANINKSLSALGNVINALSTMASGSKKVFIPYRNSKLTRVLQESLGGNALTTMMAALSPSRTNADESLSTLNYAKRAKTIKVNATKNDEAEQIAKLEEEVEALRLKLAEQASGLADTSRYETQLQEMESFMKQTWEDKERQSLEHEEERKRLEQEAQRTVERLHEERKRRLRLLEEKGDLELTVQELKQLQGGELWTPCTSGWPSQISRLLSLENRVTAQCRACCLLKEAVCNDVEHWCEKRRQVQDGGKEEDGGAGLRMLLQQAERKVGTMMREFESLAKHEQELATEVALWMPQVQRVVSGIAHAESSEEKEEKSEEPGASNEVSEDYQEVLGLVLRQLDSRRMKVWGQIAEDHKALGDFVGQFQALVDCSRALGAEVEELEEETRLELEVGGSSGSRARPPAPLHGDEVSAALSVPLGLATEDLPDTSISASSNQQACTSVRLFSGVNRMKCAFSGWSPVEDATSEYLQVDLGKPTWVSSLALQGRRPLIFKRPPVRLIHDIVVAAHVRHQALAAGKPDFSSEQLDYKQLQNADRQAKVDFFELLLAKAGHAVKAAGLQDKVPPLKVSPSDILGGKNTVESNRLLQLLCYLGLRKKLEGSSYGGLLDVSDQWATKFTVSWSEKGQDWAPLTTPSESQAFFFEGCSDAETVRVLFEVLPVEISSSDAKSAHRAVVCISFYGYKTWSTLQSDVPSVQTSIGAFGHLPFIYYCVEGFYKTQTATSNKIGLVKPRKIRVLNDTIEVENPSIRGCKPDGTQRANRKPFMYGLSEGLPGCYLLNATGMQVVQKASIRVELVLTGVNGSKPADQLMLLFREPGGSLQPAGAWAPGVTVRTLNKKREGSMGGTHASFKDEILDAIVQFFSPRFKNVYTTELESQFQDEEEETSTLRKELSGKKYNMSKAMLDLLFPRKQYYKMTLRINSEHVVQEMEVGRVPQLVFLLTGLGGYISVVTSILHLIFVKRFPASRVVETYDATTPFWGEQSAGELAVEGFLPLGIAQPPRAVRYLRIFPQEWHNHPSFRLEVFGWADGKIKVETPIPPSLREAACRLDVVRRRAQVLQRCLALASAATAERWREAQRAEEEKAMQAMQERTQVEQQLQETLAQLEEMRKAYNLLQDQAAESEQKLADAEAEQLRLGVEQDSANSQVQSLEEKLAQALEDAQTERDKVRDLEAKGEEMKSSNEDLQQQIGVLTEERDLARAKEELLFDTLAAKEEELLNTNEGYCYLTDQLNELKDEYAEKVDECDRTIESLHEQNKKLLDEDLKLRQELGDSKRRNGELEK